METINTFDPYRLVYTIWLFATAASLIYLARDALSRLHLGLRALFVWSLFLLGFGPVGLIFYGIVFRKIRRLPESEGGYWGLENWRVTLAASAARASVYMLWFFYSLLFIIFVVAENGSPLVTLIMLYVLAFLIFLVISSRNYQSTTGSGFWKSLRSSFVTEYTALNLVFAGTLLTNILLERVLPVQFADAMHPMFWVRASISGVAGLVMYYPFAFWLRSGKFFDWSAYVAVEPFFLDTSSRFPDIRRSWPALLISIIVAVAFLGIMIEFL
jgi:hypothetical protein